MRKVAFILAFLLLASAAYAMWNQPVNVLVEDSKHRPVPHAKVIMAWQLSERDQNHEEVGYTDYRGIVLFNMSNYMQLGSQTRYLATARAEYGAGSLLVTNSRVFDVRGYPDPIPLQLPVYRVKINVLTPPGKPVRGAMVYIAPWTREADDSGVAEFILPQANTFATVVYNDVQVSKNLLVGQDSEINVTLEMFKLSIKVVDEDGMGHLARISFGNKTYPTDSKGRISFDPFPAKMANLTIESGGRSQEIQIEMSKEKDIAFTFDSAPPKIYDVARTALIDGKKTITAKIKDEGEFASGLSAVLLYLWVNESAKDPVNMYPKDATTFAVTLPYYLNDTQVSYYVKAIDKQGNSISSQMETYGLLAPPPINQTINQTTNQKGNQTDGNQTGGGGFSLNFGGINWWIVIGIVAILIIAIVAYIYIKED